MHAHTCAHTHQAPLHTPTNARWLRLKNERKKLCSAEVRSAPELMTHKAKFYSFPPTCSNHVNVIKTQHKKHYNTNTYIHSHDAKNEGQGLLQAGTHNMKKPKKASNNVSSFSKATGHSLLANKNRLGGSIKSIHRGTTSGGGAPVASE